MARLLRILKRFQCGSSLVRSHPLASNNNVQDPCSFKQFLNRNRSCSQLFIGNAGGNDAKSSVSRQYPERASDESIPNPPEMFPFLRPCCLFVPRRCFIVQPRACTNGTLSCHFERKSATSKTRNPRTNVRVFCACRVQLLGQLQ